MITARYIAYNLNASVFTNDNAMGRERISRHTMHKHSVTKNSRSAYRRKNVFVVVSIGHIDILILEDQKKTDVDIFFGTLHG